MIHFLSYLAQHPFSTKWPNYKRKTKEKFEAPTYQSAPSLWRQELCSARWTCWSQCEQRMAWQAQGRHFSPCNPGHDGGEPSCCAAGEGAWHLRQPWSELQRMCGLQEAVFFVVRLSVGFMPHSVGNGIIQVCSLLPLASHCLCTVYL